MDNWKSAAVMLTMPGQQMVIVKINYEQNHSDHELMEMAIQHHIDEIYLGITATIITRCDPSRERQADADLAGQPEEGAS